MAESVGQFFSQYLPPQAVVFLISLLPILELRGGLIVSALLGLPWLEGALISIVGNALPVPIIILFVLKVLDFLSRRGPLQKMARWFQQKGRAGGEKLKAKYGNRLWLGLFLFVAIPLPGTGAWTGSLIAAFLGLPPRESAPPIAMGILGAAAVMSVLTYVIPWLVRG
jgi:uncharacterized membrane protein